MAKNKKTDSDVAGSSGVKRIKHQADDNGDDDFEIVPYRARTKNTDPPSSESEVEEVDTGNDQRRVSPKVLVDALKRMNPRQMKAVEDLGFGNIFHLQVAAVPGKIISWCLESFRPITCSLELPNKTLLHIAAEDVYLIFGFPRGALRIDKNTRTKDKEIVEEWADRFGKSKYRVLPSDVVSAMLEEVDGGDWFRRFFLMLVETCLFENAADGYVKPKIMDIIRDLSKIRQHDWCDHMITSLLRTHERWAANKNKKFTGPSVFLALFYVDRLVHYKRHVDRAFPLMKGWTSDALRVRQRSEVDNIGFGCGYVDNRFAMNNMVHDKGMVDLTAGEGTSNHTYTDAKAYTHNLILTAKKLADSMSCLVNLIMDAPLNIRQNESFSHVVQSTTALIGIKCPMETAQNETVEGCTQKLFNVDWGTPEWQDSIVKMMEVFEEKQQLEQRLGDPSFSLGLTQDPNFNHEVKIETEQVSDKVDVDVDVAKVIGNSFQDNVKFGSRALQHETSDDGIPILDQPLPLIDTSEKACDAIDSVVKNLNVEHFLDELNLQNIGDVDEIEPQVEPPIGDGCQKVQTLTVLTTVDKEKSTVNEETVDDIVNVLNMDPSILDTHTIGGVENENPVEEANCDKEGDDETIGEYLKKSGKPKFTRKSKGITIDKGKGKVKPSVGDVGISIKSVVVKKQDKMKLPAVAVEVNLPRHTMAKRSDSVKKKSSTMLSPFNERAVSVTNKLTTEEKEMYHWLVSYSDGSEYDMLFGDENVVAFRSDLKTLQTQTYLTAGVLNAWACHLNYQERLRSQDSPSRFFFTTFPCSSTIVDTPPGWTSYQVQHAFYNRIEAEMEVVRDFKIGNIDMVFFPICHSIDFYVLVIDMKRRMKVLLDNSSAMDDELPSTVAKLFCQWLINNNYHVKGRSLINMPIQRMKLPWRDVDNKVDCGVYAMRHMETYMGQRLKEWKIGLDVNAGKTLQDLRVKYCKVLLTSAANHQRWENTIRVEAWFDGFRHVNKKDKK